MDVQLLDAKPEFSPSSRLQVWEQVKKCVPASVKKKQTHLPSSLQLFNRPASLKSNAT